MTKSPKYPMVVACMYLILAVSGVFGQITLQDDLGRDVIVNSPSERIVFMMENALKTYYAVGEPQDVVALKDDQWMKAPRGYIPDRRPRFREEANGENVSRSCRSRVPSKGGP